MDNGDLDDTFQRTSGRYESRGLQGCPGIAEELDRQNEVRGLQCHPGAVERTKGQDGFPSPLCHTETIEAMDRRDEVPSILGHTEIVERTDGLNELWILLCLPGVAEKTDGRNEVGSHMRRLGEVVMSGGHIEVQILPCHTGTMEGVDCQDETLFSHGETIERADHQGRILIHLRCLKVGARLGSSLSRKWEKRRGGRIGWLYDSMEL